MGKKGTVMNIEFTEAEARFLTEFAAKQYEGARDNVGTVTPIHVVERREEYFSAGDGDAWACEVGDDCRLYADFDAMLSDLRADGMELPPYAEVVYEDVNGITVWDDEDYCRAFSITASRGHIIVTYRPVAFFLIRDEAVRYRDGYQKHNCGDCRIYTYGLGYSNNGDLPVFRNLLLRMGQALAAEAALSDGQERRVQWRD